jgi:hypothetical protein
LAVCRASRVKSRKSTDKAIFILQTASAKVRGIPDNRVFCAIGGAKIHKRNRLLGACGILRNSYKEMRDFTYFEAFGPR